MLEVVINECDGQSPQSGNMLFVNPFYSHVMATLCDNSLKSLATLLSNNTPNTLILSLVSLNTGHNNSVISAYGDELALTSQQATALFNVIKHHLAQDDIVLKQIDNYHGLITFSNYSPLQLEPVSTVKHQSVMTQLEKFETNSIWLRLLTELQMLLNLQSLNPATEAQHSPQVNSVWLWGGEIPQIKNSVDMIVSDDKLIKQWCQHNSIKFVSIDELNSLDNKLSNSISHVFISKPNETKIAKTKKLLEGRAYNWRTNNSEQFIKKPTLINRLIGLWKFNENNKKRI